MLTLAQINAETDDALTDEMVLTIENLVQQADIYEDGLFPDFFTLLADEQSTPTVKTKVLRAIVTALGNLPPLVVESQGSSDSRKYFATKQNWEALAKDVLALFYKRKIFEGNRIAYAIAHRRIENLVLDGESPDVAIIH